MRVRGDFKGLEWKPIKRGNNESMYLIVSVMVPSKADIDLAYLDDMRDDTLSIRYHNSVLSTGVVELEGKVKSVRPEDSELLLFASEENQGVMLTLSHKELAVDPAKVATLVAMTHEVEQVLDVDLFPLDYQTSMFGDERGDEEYTKDVEE